MLPLSENCGGTRADGTKCICQLSQEQLEDMGYGFGTTCPDQDCQHDYNMHFQEIPFQEEEAEDIGSDFDRESTVYDYEYFEKKRSNARPKLITHVCVLSIVVHGPYGLMRSGLRDFFREALRSAMPSEGHIKWNRSGTKIRVIMGNYQPHEKENVVCILNKLVEEGSDFHFSEKCDITFQQDTVSEEDVLLGIEVPPRRERARTMSSCASEGDICHNEKCNQTHGVVKLCKKCRAVKYCSRKCMKADASRHGLLCKPASPAKAPCGPKKGSSSPIKPPGGGSPRVGR